MPKRQFQKVKSQMHEINNPDFLNFKLNQMTQCSSMQAKIWQNGLQGSYYESRTAEAVAGAVLLLYPPVRQSEGGGGGFLTFHYVSMFL